MSNKEFASQRRDDRQALETWMKGDKQEPFILEKRESGYCACYLLFQSPFENIGLLFQYIIIWLAGQIPFSGIKIFLYRMTGVKIGKDVYIAPGVVIDPIFPKLIELKDGSVLGIESMVLTHEYTNRGSRIGMVSIGKNSIIGTRSVIRSGVKIGDECTVGACSFVNKDVKDNLSVGGTPAKPLKRKQK